MTHLELQSGQVKRYLQLVALMLIGMMLSGVRCAEACTFFTTVQTQKPEMPCHRHKQSTPSVPSEADTCKHHDLVAEKRSADDVFGDPAVVVASLIPIATEPEILKDRFDPPVQLSPPTRLHPLALSAILRV